MRRKTVGRMITSHLKGYSLEKAKIEKIISGGSEEARENALPCWEFTILLFIFNWVYYGIPI